MNKNAKNAAQEVVNAMVALVKANVGWFVVKAIIGLLETVKIPLGVSMSLVSTVYWGIALLLLLSSAGNAIKYMAAQLLQKQASSRFAQEVVEEEEDAPATRRARERARSRSSEY